MVRAGSRYSASRIDASVGDVACLGLGHRHREGGDISDVVGSGVVAIEYVERHDRPSIVKHNGSADPQIQLVIRSSTKLVERCRDAINRDAVAVVRSGDGEKGARSPIATMR
jgi:hypothetical protein